jgi:hypothetical protein
MWTCRNDERTPRLSVDACPAAQFEVRQEAAVSSLPIDHFHKTDNPEKPL